MWNLTYCGYEYQYCEENLAFLYIIYTRSSPIKFIKPTIWEPQSRYKMLKKIVEDNPNRNPKPKPHIYIRVLSLSFNVKPSFSPQNIKLQGYFRFVELYI